MWDQFPPFHSIAELMVRISPTSTVFRVGSFVFYDLEFFSSLPALTCQDLSGRITSAVMPSVA